MIKIYYSQRFKEELSEIALFIANQAGKDAANKVIESIMSSIKLLNHFPKIGVFRGIDKTNTKEFHLLFSGNYFVYYSIFRDKIYIDGIKDTRANYYKI